MRRASLLAIGGLVVLGIVSGIGIVRRTALHARVYTVGFENDPPFHLPDAQGNPVGLSVDVLNEAARRTGIRLRWMYQAQSSERALRTGSVDLWPIMTIREERKAFLHFTEPYRESEARLIVRAERPFTRQQDLDGASVAHNGLPLTERLIRAALPGAQLSVVEDPHALIERVCRGAVDAVYMDEFAVVSALMNGANCSGVRLRAISVPTSRSQLGIGSTFAAAGVADELRDAISDMSDDGTLTLLVGRWTSITARSIEQSAALVQSRRRERNLAFVTAGTLSLLLLTGWLALRIRHQSHRARLAEAERARLAEQLQQSQRIETVGRLAGGVAHDFNNLLTVINGYADMLQADDRLTDDQRAQVGQIADAGGQAANLTQQLLAFSRKQVVQPRILNVNEVVEDVTRMLRRLVGEHIELTTALEPALGLVKADPSQVRQVLMNLVVNSRDAMPAGGRLRIETANVTIDDAAAAAHPHAAAGPHVMLAVSDTGSGIAPEVIGSIFEPFFTTKARGEGTGLGLSIVYGVVRQSGGWITVESAPGRGTTFRVYLPRVEADGRLRGTP